MDPKSEFKEGTKEDMCPICKQHPNDLDYIGIFPSPNVMFFVCKVCGVMYIPQSIRKEMDKLQKEEKKLITPAGAVPDLKQ